MRNVLRSKGAAEEQSCSDMLKTVCGASHGVNPKIGKRQNGLLDGSSDEFAATLRVVYDFLEIILTYRAGERVALHGDFYGSNRHRKQMAARQDRWRLARARFAVQYDLAISGVFKFEKLGVIAHKGVVPPKFGCDR